MARRTVRRKTRAKAAPRKRRTASRKRVKRTARGRAATRSARKVRRPARKRAAKARAPKRRRRATVGRKRAAATARPAAQMVLGTLTPPPPVTPPRIEPIQPSPWGTRPATEHEEFGAEEDEEPM